MKISIIGGGIAGCTTAYFLAREGHDVTLFERDSLASHASGFAQGGLKPKFDGSQSRPYEVLAQYSVDLHKTLAKDLGYDSGDNLNLLRKPSVSLVTNAAEAELAKQLYAAFADNDEADIRWLGLGELSHIDARISSSVLGGLYFGEAYEVDPYKLTLTLWQAAEQLGAVLVNREVTEIDVSAGRVSGVVTASGVTKADSVVVAAGPWSAGMLAKVGVIVPVTPLKGQILRLDAPGPPLKISLWWDTDYATSKSDGLLWIGTTEEEMGFDDQITDVARDRIIGSAVGMLPFLEDAELVTQTACLRPMTPDKYPIIDAGPGPEGLVISSGAGRQGILLGPAMGAATAALVTGAESPVDVNAFGLGRFG